jgi:hypothetical protein
LKELLDSAPVSQLKQLLDRAPEELVIAESSRKSSRSLEEAVQDGVRTVSRYGCGTGTVREHRKRNVHRWKAVPVDW